MKILNRKLPINPGISWNDMLLFTPIKTLLLQLNLKDLEGPPWALDRSKQQRVVA